MYSFMSSYKLSDTVHLEIAVAMSFTG